MLEAFDFKFQSPEHHSENAASAQAIGSVIKLVLVPDFYLDRNILALFPDSIPYSEPSFMQSSPSSRSLLQTNMQVPMRSESFTFEAPVWSGGFHLLYVRGLHYLTDCSRFKPQKTCSSHHPPSCKACSVIEFQCADGRVIPRERSNYKQASGMHRYIATRRFTFCCTIP